MLKILPFIPPNLPKLYVAHSLKCNNIHKYIKSLYNNGYIMTENYSLRNFKQLADLTGRHGFNYISICI